MPTTSFYLNKSTFTATETGSTGAPTAFLVVTDDSNVNAQNIVTTAAFNGVPTTLFVGNNQVGGAGTGDTSLQANQTAGTDWQISLGNTPQAFTDQSGLKVFAYPIKVGNWDAHGKLGPHGDIAWLQTDPALTPAVAITANNQTIQALSPIRFSSTGEAYMVDVQPGATNPSYLSADTRVFQIRAGSNQPFGASSNFGSVSVGNGGGPQPALTFIQNLLTALNANGSLAANASTIFDGLAPDENTSGLTFQPTDTSNTPVYNFAIARIRAIDVAAGAGLSAQVAFRIFRTLYANLQFDGEQGTPTNYRNTAGNSIAALGRIASGAGVGQIVSIPFFAAPRMHDQTQQTDPHNKIELAAGNGPTDFYVGVFVDINDSTGFFPDPALPIGQDNNFNPAGPLNSVGQLLMQSHCCMVVEILNANDPTAPGAAPHNSGNLAQRNLAFANVFNYGAEDATRSIQHSFEYVPFSPPGKKDEKPKAQDELLFLTEHVPEGTMIELFMPGVNLASVRHPEKARVEAIGKDTLRFPIRHAAKITIPVDPGARAPGVITVNFPPKADVGQRYVIDVLQLHPPTGVVVGAFQVRAPVIKARVGLQNVHLDDELFERRAARAPAGWGPVLQRQSTFARQKLRLTAREVVKEYGLSAARQIQIVLDRIELPSERKEPLSLLARVFDGGALVTTHTFRVAPGAPGVVAVGEVVYSGPMIDHIAVKLGQVGLGGVIERHVRSWEATGGSFTHVAEVGSSEGHGADSWRVWYHVVNKGDLLRR